MRALRRGDYIAGGLAILTGLLVAMTRRTNGRSLASALFGSLPASDFVKRYGGSGGSSMGIHPPGKTIEQWEAAVLEMAKRGDVITWPWTDVTLSDGQHTAIIKVQNDLFSIGTADDRMRLPLRASTAQSIANLSGYLLPTPWLSYQIWRAAPYKLARKPMSPNRGAVLADWAMQDRTVESELAKREGSPLKGMVTGQKKDVVISNTFNPRSFNGAGNVVIFGWYNPSPPSPDVFDDHGSLSDPNRQPQQPNSGGAHDINYVDYSHGVRFLHGTALVDGSPMPLTDLYQHPTLSKLVSHEGPIKMSRYPANIPPQPRV